ncbi:hypothetical protein [Arthrobacter oryzae]|uniref:Uncharacterized protein n=1 Tax=Arthrobacter oryzae TaxID=409290 RepID=A0A495E734_9MICC|nr:hypothetical protein [Arthrobacter oryzae]RKR12740.1 hypothetical protein C8D78_3646 [Arthrobacter oryzae]
MQSKRTWQITVGSILLAATMFVLPMPLAEVFTGIAGQGAAVMFVVGLGLLVGGLGFIAVGLRKQSRNLRTARTYDTREASSSNEDRPVNPYAVPNPYGAVRPPI